MLALAPSLGCPDAQADCLCRNADFGFGVRDCANQACGDAAAAQQVSAYGTQYCGGGSSLNAILHSDPQLTNFQALLLAATTPTEVQAVPEVLEVPAALLPVLAQLLLPPAVAMTARRAVLLVQLPSLPLP